MQRQRQKKFPSHKESLQATIERVGFSHEFKSDGYWKSTANKHSVGERSGVLEVKAQAFSGGWDSSVRSEAARAANVLQNRTCWRIIVNTLRDNTHS